MPDESLYINLSRSVWDGRVLLRGQAVPYDNLLYPMLLAPLRALPGVDFYRAAQLLNAAVMRLAVLPAFYLARGVTLCGRRALAVAALTMLMPDLAMSRILMAESVCYPLGIFALYLIYRTLGEGGTLADAVCASLACGVCYMAKPGYAALGCAPCSSFGP